MLMREMKLRSKQFSYSSRISKAMVFKKNSSCCFERKCLNNFNLASFGIDFANRFERQAIADEPVAKVHNVEY